MIIVVFGVSGAGKTTVGKLLAEELGWRFYDADDFHPPANIDKMKRGIPLTDADRRPWLESLRELIDHDLGKEKNAVVACSALKKAYRDCLRVSGQVKFVFLHGSRARITAQLQRRAGHFMTAALLDSQFADLEEPKSSEGVLIIDIGTAPRDLVDQIKTKLQLHS